MCKSVLAVAAAAVLFTATAHGQSAIDGNWSLLFETPVGMLDADASFESEGEELTGTLESQAGSTTLKGTVKGNAVTFIMNVNTPQGDMMIQLNGEVVGDDIKGTFDFGQGIGNWSGKRKAAR